MRDAGAVAHQVAERAVYRNASSKVAYTTRRDTTTPCKGVCQRSSSGTVRLESTFSTRTSSPHTMYRYSDVNTGVQVVRVM